LDSLNLCLYKLADKSKIFVAVVNHVNMMELLWRVDRVPLSVLEWFVSHSIFSIAVCLWKVYIAYPLFLFKLDTCEVLTSGFVCQERSCYLSDYTQFVYCLLIEWTSLEMTAKGFESSVFAASQEFITLSLTFCLIA